MLRELATIASVALPVNERWALRRCRYTPDSSSKGRVCIATGIHGDEMMGQFIIYHIARRIRQNPNALLGTVDLYPMLNPLGLDVLERTVPTGTQLDMNRSFPGRPRGTTLESMCDSIMQDMMGSDLVLDIHASSQHKSEMYEVRISSSACSQLVPKAHALCPDIIWTLEDRSTFSSSLVGALTEAGTDAMVIEMDEQYHPEAAEKVIEGIFCKLKEMGLWAGDARRLPTEDIPTVLSAEQICRVPCEQPGVYVPETLIGTHVKAGQVLGEIIDALAGAPRETITAPCDGLIFSQRNYSAVYPGTLIARIRKEQA